LLKLGEGAAPTGPDRPFRRNIGLDARLRAGASVPRTAGRSPKSWLTRKLGEAEGCSSNKLPGQFGAGAGPPPSLPGGAPSARRRAARPETSANPERAGTALSSAPMAHSSTRPDSDPAPDSAPDPQRALVVGASGGLGRACSEAFLRAGHQVVGTFARHPQALEELQRHPRFELRALDMHDAGQVDALAGEVARMGGLDALVLAPGAIQRGRADELDAASLSSLWRDNVEGPWRLWSAFRGSLRSRKGCAVGFTCVGLEGLGAKRQIAAYAAVKSAWLVLLRSAAQEEAQHGVRFNAIAPGWIAHPGAEPETRGFDPERIPLGRLGSPEDVARAVTWLCSPAAGYVTGAQLDVAGGFGL
jgi:meso-butanediol dehydrogenase/(S,S)-butanediol dehydrogenase/diacetyl reductase